MDNFIHRGDFKASRKSCAFSAINPLTPADLAKSPQKSVDISRSVEQVRDLRKEIKIEIERVNANSKLQSEEIHLP